MKKTIAYLLMLSLLLFSSYGAIRFYSHLTDGFRIDHIFSSFRYQKEWEVSPLDLNEQLVVDQALDQPYFYLGKGCQAYAFLSQDGQYVIKFFKYPRYSLQPWVAYFPPLPSIAQYKQEKLEKKGEELEGFIKSCKIAFNHLKKETALLFVHFNKTTDLKRSLVIFDKRGTSHTLTLDQMEFCLQRHALMICKVLKDYQLEGQQEKAKQLIDRLLQLILSEYSRGLADQDHALMQNTGVVDNQPIHIDIGQFVYDEKLKDPFFFHQELFTKTYKFKIWLSNHYPELKNYLDGELEKIIGSSYSTMQPKFRKK